MNLAAAVAVIRSALLALLLAVGAGVPGQAQDTAPAAAAETTAAIDYAAWDQVAARAEAALADGRASVAAFEELRAALVRWRGDLAAAGNQNALRIRSLRAQVDALGALPASGAEPPEIAARRDELNAQLNAMEAPRLRAEEAFKRADGLIVEIDDLIGARQTEQLLRLGPSPLNPSQWPAAVAAVAGSAQRTSDELSAAIASDNQRQMIKNNAPAMLAVLVAGILLLLRGPAWVAGVARRLPDLTGRPGAADLGAIGRRLLQFALRIAGVLALLHVVRLSGLAGFRGQIVVDAVTLAGIAFLTARYLVAWLIPSGDDRENRIARAAQLAGALSFVWSGHVLIDRWADFDFYTAGTQAVLSFPLLVAGGALLLGFVRLIRTEAAPSPADDATVASGPAPARQAAAQWGRTFLIGVSVAAPLIAAVGYLDAAKAILYPTLLSLMLLGAMLALSALFRAGYAVLAVKDGEAVARSLVPVLVNLALTGLSVPVVALIWGVRPARIADLWTRFSAGISIGGTRISPGDFLIFAAVFVAGLLVTRAIQATLRNSVLPKTRIDGGGQAALVSGIGYGGIFLAAVIAISSAGIDLSSLAIVAGALSVGIGFGLQNIVSNFVSGVILLIERPIAIGDWIEVGGVHGTVREISVRSTRVETFDRSDVILPNSDLVSGTVTNYTKTNLVGRVTIPVSVAYGTDTRRVAAILREVADAQPIVLRRPPPSVIFQNFGADGLEFELRAYLRDVNEILNVRSEINHEIARRFGEEGIEIPFAQRDIWLRNPEALTGATGATGAGG